MALQTIKKKNRDLRNLKIANAFNRLVSLPRTQKTAAIDALSRVTGKSYSQIHRILKSFDETESRLPVLYWLDTITDETIRDTAISYCLPERENDKAGGLSEALVYAFDWAITTEGFEYWLQLHDAAQVSELTFDQGVLIFDAWQEGQR